MIDVNSFLYPMDSMVFAFDACISNNRTTCLLTLPRSDLLVHESSSLSVETNATPTTDTKGKNGALLLLQLPLGWTISDLKSAKFVVPALTATQAALVSEHKQTSFHVQRVETSNCFIMVPPAPALTFDGEESATTTITKEIHLVSNRVKMIRSVPACLLKPGGNGASFLELRPKTLSKGTIEQLFRQHRLVLDPFDRDDQMSIVNGQDISQATCSSAQGVTVCELANQLQVSEAQVAQVMSADKALFASVTYYPLPKSIPTAFVILSEEAYMEAYKAIVAALAEIAELTDYARGVSRNLLIQSAVERFSCSESRQEVMRCLPGGKRGLVSFCVNRLARDDGKTNATDIEKSTENDGTIMDIDNKVIIDVSKVAAIVARQLLQRQTQPWEQSLFVDRWQAELPGVGLEYQVSTLMLGGIAIEVPTLNGDREASYWQYFPADALPRDPSCGFASIFSIKSKWQFDEIQPYLDKWSDGAGCTHGDLLLQFTKITTEEKDGVTMEFITRKT
ncbi:hypothetical protein MPSEU_000796500 [Mayamaea pseudoterrestris]|nr:hypothetical protein MPSEU_000796500 [Mayamaea pseudoterrestris]